MTARLSPAIEASALIRRAESEGGVGTILAKGDADRGTLILVLLERGHHAALLERLLDERGAYRWNRCGPEGGDSEVADFLARRRRIDPDLWLIELNIAQAERFIAETIAAS